MLSGADIKRFRKKNGLTQAEAAQKVGLSQSALSLIERGRLAVTDEHLARFKESFSGGSFDETFADFMASIEIERTAVRAMRSTESGQHLTLTVWQWEEGFALDDPPRPELAVGLVTVPFVESRMIAFLMPKASNLWTRHETLVFSVCESSALKDGDICLFQYATRRGRKTPSILAVAHVASPHTPGRLESIHGRGANPLANDASITALLRVAFRVRAV